MSDTPPSSTCDCRARVLAELQRLRDEENRLRSRLHRAGAWLRRARHVASPELMRTRVPGLFHSVKLPMRADHSPSQECCVCRRLLALSAVVCPCSSDRVACLLHAKEVGSHTAPSGACCVLTRTALWATALQVRIPPQSACGVAVAQGHRWRNRLAATAREGAVAGAGRCELRVS